VKPFANLCLVALISLGTTGCVFIDGEHVTRDDWRDDQRDNREMISQLEIGSTRTAVVKSLGTPSDSEAFTQDGEEMRVLFYRTQRTHSDGQTTRDETTAVIFKNDVLVGWGDRQYAEIRQH
jgi:outer membrane protein assembly factor BamE (lipoprotein component of BamABCDE complex)